MPLDRRVWQESLALRDAGYEVVVICPQMHDQVLPEERLEGVYIYRHRLAAEAKGFAGFFLEYASALWGRKQAGLEGLETASIQGASYLPNPPDLLFLVTLRTS
ncbi:MAG: hypothetical protein U1G07_21075 [Verrucomicrobiota bacterium]